MATPVFLIFMSVGTVFGIGGTSVISRALGEEKIDYAKKAWEHRQPSARTIADSKERAGMKVSDFNCTYLKRNEIPGTLTATTGHHGKINYHKPVYISNTEAMKIGTFPLDYDTDGKVDFFVAGVGTGGTITGVGKYLKEKNPDIKVIGVEPFDSPLITKGVAGPHGIQGIGANFIPEILDLKVVDEVVTVTTEDSYAAGRRMGREEGILCGISSGTNVAAAIKLAKKLGKGKTVVTVLPDTAERYFSTPLFDE